jgi:outer membrane protein TolC
LELGFMSPIDVQQARAQVSLDEEQLLLAKNLFMERQLSLRRLITNDGRNSASRVFLPVQTPHLDVPQIDREKLLTLAFNKRQDYMAAVTDAEKQSVRLRFAKNQAWPNLDLVGTYGYNGLGSTWEEARDRASSSQAPQWSFGVQFSMPLGRVQGRAQLDAIKGLQQQAILRIKQSELTVTVDVDTAISRIETNRQRLVTARNTRELNEEAVRIAYRRLEEGQLSSFDLIEQQRKLYDARSRELSARADLNRAVISLWVATGTVLENTGVTVASGKKKRDLPTATKTGPFPKK